MPLLPIDGLPGPVAAPVRSASAARLARSTPSLLPLRLIALWAAADWHAVRDGTVRAASADPRWLPAAVFPRPPRRPSSMGMFFASSATPDSATT